MGKNRLKPGPKPLPPEKTRAKVLQIRLSSAEHEALRLLAEKRGVSMADLLMEPFRKG